MKDTACILIPAFEPNEALLTVIGKLVEIFKANPKHPSVILVVNDGSRTSAGRAIFARLRSEQPSVISVDLPANIGKGGALKTGLAFIAENISGAKWIVTADADGQHLPEDIWKLVLAGDVAGTPVLGIRTFGADVPLRSRLGNKITRGLFRLLYRTEIADTQTGLRGFSAECIADLRSIPSGRYAFEIDALIYFAGIAAVRQVPVSTVYEPGNPTSHFRPLLDSAQIYAVLLRQSFFSFAALVFELIVFSALSAKGMNAGFALAVSRALAGTGLFFAARRYVFRSPGKIRYQAVKYAVLVSINLFFMIVVLKILDKSLIAESYDIVLYIYFIIFILNFFTQKTYIFPWKLP